MLIPEEVLLELQESDCTQYRAIRQEAAKLFFSRLFPLLPITLLQAKHIRKPA
jgi:hypothetical protein